MNLLLPLKLQVLDINSAANDQGFIFARISTCLLFHFSPVCAGHSAFDTLLSTHANPPTKQLPRNNAKLKDTAAFPVLGKALQNERRKRKGRKSR